MLHLANGETTATLLRQAALDGEIVNADDLWMEGPLGVPEEARARELERRLGVPAPEYLGRGRDALLGRALRAPEVVFWTEADLFCQANLCEALRRFPPAHPWRVYLVAPASPSARLGHMAPAALAERYEARERLGDARLRLAHRAWEAFRSPDPREVERLLRDDLSAWPELREGLLAHLRRFPDPATGLDAIEEEALRALAQEGPLPFADLFATLQRAPRFWAVGMTDLQLAAHLRELAPLVRLEGDPPGRVAITAEGREALEGRLDALRARPVDRWIGGVHVEGPRAWRWDERGARLLPP